MAANRQKIRQQMRVFVIIWTSITLLMGLATFLAIYFTYSPISAGGDGFSLSLGSNLSNNAPGGESVVTLPSITPFPTQAAVVVVQPTQAPPVIVPTTVAENNPTLAPDNPTGETGGALGALVSGLMSQIGQTTTPQPEPVVPPATLPPTQTPEPTLQPTIPPVQDERFQLGIQVQYSLDFNPDNQNGLYRSVADDLGLNWVKQQVRWEDFERERGFIDYAVMDLVMPAAEENNLKMLLSIVTAPDWAREQGVNLDQHGPPANNADYVNFVTSIVRRYPGQVHAIEVWNEMNLDREWTSTRGLDASQYVALLRDTYNAVKAIDPNIIIISGALSPTGVNIPNAVVDDFTYIQQLIDANMLEYSDCVGAHHNGYNIPPTVEWDQVPNDPSAIYRGPFDDNKHPSFSFRSTLEGYATRIRLAGYETPLCVTEFGWATMEDLEGNARQGFEFAADNTLAEQAQWIPDAATFMEQWGQVWLAIIWNFNYAPQAGYDPDNDNVPYSLIGPGYTFRPAFDTVRQWQEAYQERTGQT